MGKHTQNFKDNLDDILDGKLVVMYGPSFRRLIKEQGKLGENKCKECGVGLNWNGKPLLLELDHINGDKNNNTRENLRWLCPNCHSQTDTYRIKNFNKLKLKESASEEKLLESIKLGGTITSILIRAGISPRGGNFPRVHNVAKKYNIKLEDYIIPKKFVAKNKCIMCGTPHINEKYCSMKCYKDDGNKIKNMKLNGSKRKTLFPKPKPIKENKRLKRNEEFKIKLEEIRIKFLESDLIDFSKTGWAKKLGNELNCSSTWASQMLQKKFPEFYKKCFKHRN